VIFACVGKRRAQLCAGILVGESFFSASPSQIAPQPLLYRCRWLLLANCAIFLRARARASTTKSRTKNNTNCTPSHSECSKCSDPYRTRATAIAVPPSIDDPRPSGAPANIRYVPVNSPTAPSCPRHTLYTELTEGHLPISHLNDRAGHRQRPTVLPAYYCTYLKRCREAGRLAVLKAVGPPGYMYGVELELYR
jgi:hypothetical protein